LTKKFFAAAAVCLLAVSCAPVGVTPIAKTEAVGKTYTTISTQSQGVQTNLLSARAVRTNGFVGICAAMAEVKGSGMLSGEATAYLRRNALFLLNGERILQGAAFAPLYTGIESLRGKQARCVATDVPWKNAFAAKRIEVRMRSGTIGS